MKFIRLLAAVLAAAATLVRPRRRPGRLRLDRASAALRLAARGGVRYAASAPRLFAAAGEQRQLLREDLALRTAEDVADTLGAMKGVMMKIGQLASYVDDGLSPAVRHTLARLQDSVPPMSPQLAAAAVEEELGVPPERAFARWDPRPIAAASIGQVHRAVTLDGRAVAVKVQYPGIAETIAADLRNVALLRRMLRIAAPAQDVDALLSELSERIGEELDYRREAANQRLLAGYYDGHPTIRIPGVVSELSTSRLLTSELSTGVRFAEVATWPQHERDLAAETIYRFVFRSLYDVRAFTRPPPRWERPRPRGESAGAWAVCVGTRLSRSDEVGKSTTCNSRKTRLSGAGRATADTSPPASEPLASSPHRSDVLIVPPPDM
jgi:predicted unusual protein kinase regulating ubiquinone biosynthesis (AarF/ABC1/UbiB family)